jgi:hypothetical protein
MTVRGSTHSLTVTFRDAGGAVVDPTALLLSILREGVTVAGPFTVPAVVRDAPGLYRYEWPVPPDAVEGTYTAAWTATLPGESTPDVTYAQFPVTAVPADEARLVVQPEELAERIEIPVPLTAEHRRVLTDALLDAQTDVEGYLGRPVVPSLYTEADRWSYDDVNFNLTMLGDEPLVRIVDVTAQVYDGVLSGYYTVQYLAGIDARTDPVLRPIRRYILLHALNSPEVGRLWKQVTKAKGEVRSVSAEGQSVSFAAATLSGTAATGTKPGDGTPGTLPTLESLDRWRVAGRRVHQAPTMASDWPYSGGRW